MTVTYPEVLTPEKAIGDTWIGKAVGFFAIYTIFYEIFGGLARYILATTGGMFLNNLPSVAALLFFGLYFVQATLRFKVEKYMVFLLIFIFIYIVYMRFNPMTFDQSIFGFYIWSIFLLGALVCVYSKEQSLIRYMEIFWICAVAGVLMNYIVKFPWIGMSYEVNGMKMEVARDWSADGFDRLPGFARASFSTAIVIVVAFGQILRNKKYSPLMKCLGFTISAIAIFLTTSKTELFLLIALVIFWVTYLYMKHIGPGTRLAFNYAWLAIASLCIATIVLPLALSSDAVSSFSGTSFMFFNVNSMLDRITSMWPGAFELINKDGNMLLGRGIGGIGMAQYIGVGDSANVFVNSADNLFLYIYVSTGLLVVIPVFYAFIGNLNALYRQNINYFEAIILLSFCLVGVGITSNAVEDPTLCLLLGFLVARGFIASRTTDVIRSESVS